MALGKYAVDYEQRVNYDRLRGERLQRAKDQINKDGLGALITWDEANIRFLTSYKPTSLSIRSTCSRRSLPEGMPANRAA